MPPSDTKVSLAHIFQHLNSDFLLFDDRPVSGEQLLCHAWYLIQILPHKQHFINLCRDRYFFSVVFLAGVLSKRPNLLPPNQAKKTIEELLRVYPDSICVTDNQNEGNDDYFIIDESYPDCNLEELPNIDPTKMASISFTSGSTGQPKAIAKSWGEFESGALLATRQLSLENKKLRVIATVPLQHMYGLETCFFWPLFSELAVFHQQPFFPEDIRKQLSSVSSPCLLVATPKHLQSCVEAKIKWENIERVLSSTAPMPLKLAEQIEACFNAPLDEIYGSTETLSYASRRITKSPQWQPYQGIRVLQEDQSNIVSGGHLNQPVMLDDQLKINDDGSFTVIGRSSDMVKIAGKRASLLQLNTILKKLPEVEDGVFYVTQRERLGVVIVGRINKKTLLTYLKQYLDPIFMPRTIDYIDFLPRNELGKLERGQFEQLIEQLARDNNN